MKIALLIDGENIGSKFADRLVSYTQSLGQIVCKRIYADFSQPSYSPWKSYILKYNLEPIQTFHLITGKNSADIALCIDAIELALSTDIDTFVIASSDSDISSLILKLDRLDKRVIIAGQNKTHDLLKNSCTTFVNLDSEQLPLDFGAELDNYDMYCSDDECMSTLEVPLNQDQILYVMDDTPLALFASDINVDTIKSKEQEIAPAAKATLTPKTKKSAEHIKKFVEEVLAQANGHSIYTSQLTEKVRKQYPDFKVKDYGFKKISELFVSLGFKYKKQKISNPDKK